MPVAPPFPAMPWACEIVADDPSTNAAVRPEVEAVRILHVSLATGSTPEHQLTIEIG